MVNKSISNNCNMYKSSYFDWRLRNIKECAWIKSQSRATDKQNGYTHFIHPHNLVWAIQAGTCYCSPNKLKINCRVYIKHHFWVVFTFLLNATRFYVSTTWQHIFSETTFCLELLLILIRQDKKSIWPIY